MTGTGVAPHGSGQAPVVVGVDGGGTCTRLEAITEMGQRVGQAEVGPTSGTGRDPAELGSWLAGVVREVAGQHPVAAVHAGLAGAGEASVQAGVRTILSETVAGAPVAVSTDLEVAFHHAFGDGPGILLLSGTGSACLARDGAGEWSLVGGWGPVLGDEGSGYQLARSALAAVARAADGRGRPTTLSRVVLDHTGMGRPRLLARWARAASRQQVAALAPAVLKACAAGDEVARGLVSRAVGELAAHVDAAAGGSGGREPAYGRRVAFAGGLLQTANPLEAQLREAVTVRGYACLPTPAVGLQGAVALARDLAGWSPLPPA